MLLNCSILEEVTVTPLRFNIYKKTANGGKPEQEIPNWEISCRTHRCNPWPPGPSFSRPLFSPTNSKITTKLVGRQPPDFGRSFFRICFSAFLHMFSRCIFHPFFKGPIIEIYAFLAASFWKMRKFAKVVPITHFWLGGIHSDSSCQPGSCWCQSNLEC